MSAEKASIKFCGAAGEVTGSMILVNLDGFQILLDAGAFQGSCADEKNRAPLDFDPRAVKVLFLSHAHLDHIGRIPTLVQRGFEGEIVATPATRELAEVILNDSLKIQEEDGGGLFGPEDVKKALSLFVAVSGEYPVYTEATSGLSVRFIPSEHILGSASIFIESPISLLYTGDLGGENSSMHSIPMPPVSCDYLIIESTYGDKGNTSNREGTTDKIIELVELVTKNKSKLLLPVFSVDRAAEILIRLKVAGVNIPVFLDTPMGVTVLGIYARNKFLLSKISTKLLQSSGEAGNGVYPEQFESIKTKSASKALVTRDGPCVILSSSGMLEGGRVREHLPNILPDAKNSIAFTGYQSIGTLGRRIADGAKRVDIDGIDVQVNCNVQTLDGLSAHADKNGLLFYIASMTFVPKMVFIVHGDRDVSEGLADSITHRFKIRAKVPEHNESVSIIDGVPEQRGAGVSTEGATLKFIEYMGREVAPFVGGIQKIRNELKLIPASVMEQWAQQESTVVDKIVIPMREEEREEKPLKTLGKEEFVAIILKLFWKGYISKGLINDMDQAAKRGIGEYRKFIEKRIKNDALINDMRDLVIRNINIGDRGKESTDLGEVLRQSSHMELHNLQLSCATLSQTVR